MTKASGPARLVAILSIIFGLVAIGGGVATWATITAQLSAENITVPKDSPLVPGAKVQDPISAYAQAEIINHHALTASGGKTYAELGTMITEAKNAGDTAKADELTAAGLGARQLAVAVGTGRLLKVGDLMHDDPPLVADTLAMGETLLEITRRGFGVVGVTDAQGDLAGIITDGDLRRHLEGLMLHKAGEVMTPNPRTIGPEALAGEALALMNDRKITCLLVTAPESRTAIGILHVHDCLRAGVV